MTLDQQRMKRAYRATEDTKGSRREVWVRTVKDLGPEIQRSGLLQALAFLHRGPSKEIAEELCGEIRGHLVDRGHLKGAGARDGFLVEVRDLDRQTYMRVTRETLALSVWLKRAAQILGDERTGADHA
jgi:CRISPR/Cas system CMR-associated protein Cmr5 small subunit